MQLFLLLCAGAAQGQHSLPEVLTRVAPSVVRIRVGEARGTAFVYPTQRHVTTAYSVVNQNDKIEITLRNGAVVAAKVVAWSVRDDLAILELSGFSGATPLELETARPFAGEELILLGHAVPSLDAQDPPKPRAIPTPRFGRVAFVDDSRVGVDVDIWTGDDGAPLITPAGRVVGVVSGMRNERLGVLDAGLSARLSELTKMVGQQGTFEPHPMAKKGWFAGVYAAPLQQEYFMGAGLMTGYHYRLIGVTLAETISATPFVPISVDTSRRRIRGVFDLYATVDWEFARHRKACFGAGFTLALGAQELRQNGQKLRLEPSERSDVHAGPLLVFHVVEGLGSLTLSWAPIEPAARLDLGVVFGR